jgi:hypothetical protein
LSQSLQDTVFVSSHGERLAFSPEAAKSVVHVRQQAVLILIEALDLENLLLMVHNATPFRFILCFKYLFGVGLVYIRATEVLSGDWC